MVGANHFDIPPNPRFFSKTRQNLSPNRHFFPSNCRNIFSIYQNILSSHENKSKKNEFLPKILYLLLRRVSKMVGANQYNFPSNCKNISPIHQNKSKKNEIFLSFYRNGWRQSAKYFEELSIFSEESKPPTSPSY